MEDGMPALYDEIRSIILSIPEDALSSGPSRKDSIFVGISRVWAKKGVNMDTVQDG